MANDPNDPLLSHSNTFGTWNQVPVEYRNILEALKLEWEGLTGYRYSPGDNDQMIFMARNGVADLKTFAQKMAVDGDLKNSNPDFYNTVPWAQYGLNQAQYSAQQTTYAEEYKKATGQEPDTAALTSAFTSFAGSERLLSGTEYYQKLTNDANLQKTYGWLKYGMDYQSFQQQKLGMTQAFGRTLSDAEATTQLQYFHANQGGDHSVHAQQGGGGQQGQQQQPGAGQSVIR